jgi:hypothetical protein
MCIHKHTHTHTRTNTDTRIHTRMQHEWDPQRIQEAIELSRDAMIAHIHTHTHTHIHTYTHTHTQTHTHSLNGILSARKRPSNSVVTP